MRIHYKLWIISTLLFSIIIASGCNNSQDATETVTPRTSVETEIKDSDVTIKVKAALSSNEELKFLDITVVTRKGDVLLTGVVDNQSQIDHVDKLVMSIEGVHTLHDHLTVKPR